jgi:phosphonate transport system substrate-binding protein
MKKLVLLLLTLITFSCSESNIDSLKIGVVPAQTNGEFDLAIKKLKKHLSEKLNTEVEITVFPQYSGVVEAINYQKIDLAYLGPLTYVIAHERSGAKAIVTQLINGEPYYHSVIITQNDSKLNSIDDIRQNSKKLSVAFGNINSTSGYLIPSSEFISQGIYKNDKEHNFKSIQFSGSHDITALLVQNGKADIGTLDEAFLQEFIANKRIDGAKIKIIWRSQKLFQYPWTIRSGLDSVLESKIQNSFLEIRDKDILKAFGGASGFTKASDKDYENIRIIAKERGLIDDMD